MLAVFFGIVVVAAPVIAAVLEHSGNVGISERRHSHHDTYVTPAALTRSLIIDMAFVSAIAVILGWLCYVKRIYAKPRHCYGVFCVLLGCYVYGVVHLESL